MTQVAVNRAAAESIFRSAVAAADPYERVLSCTRQLKAFYEKGNFERLYVVGFGKAACAMARGVENEIPDLVRKGILITKDGYAQPTLAPRFQVFQAGHPVPDERGVEGAREIMSLARDADEKTLLLCLVSGGGSALFVMPAHGVTLQEKRLVTDMLLRAGASIEELNAVRKHLSMVKGGQLAALAYPASVISLILSDVIGDRLDVIASGPTVADPTTFEDALACLEKYRLLHRVPDSVRIFLSDGSTGIYADTPKDGDTVTDRARNCIIGSNKLALDAAIRRAGELGFDARILSDALCGEARTVAEMLAERALAEQCRMSDDSRPVCLLAGGETTVTVRGGGKGGRSTEMALAFGMAVEGRSNIVFLAAGTDGTDGPTDAAGALADGTTVRKGRIAGHSAEQYLLHNDSYTYFSQTGGLFVTGPTGTNVMDIDIALIGPET